MIRRLLQQFGGGTTARRPARGGRRPARGTGRRGGRGSAAGGIGGVVERFIRTRR
ncbi:MAG TPA: hypothetical protein VGB57_05915 [Allosphingosinicella sp.]|jgi:hypothetical protein